jgi:hypothetical protein
MALNQVLVAWFHSRRGTEEQTLAEMRPLPVAARYQTDALGERCRIPVTVKPPCLDLDNTNAA